MGSAPSTTKPPGSVISVERDESAENGRNDSSFLPRIRRLSVTSNTSKRSSESSSTEGQDLPISSWIKTVGERAASKDRQCFHQKYALLETLNHGSFANTYLGKDVRKQKRVTVKVIPLQRTQANTQGIAEAIAAEARILHLVEKDVNIAAKVASLKTCVRLKDFAREDGFAYIVMESCHGPLLSALEELPSLNERTLMAVFKGMIVAVKGLHDVGVVHRDVKPDNFICKGPSATRVKLCDFGFSAFAVPEGSGKRLTGVQGNAPFMSPEMLACKGYGVKTDIWSLGVCMYVIMFGQFPYSPSETGTKSSMKLAIRDGSMRPIYEPKPSLKANCRGAVLSLNGRALLETMLNRNPVQRSTANEALEHPALVNVAETVDSHDTCESSLRPMLSCAKRAGAFDAVLVEDGKDCTEIQMKYLQRHRNASLDNIGQPPMVAAAGREEEALGLGPTNQRLRRSKSAGALVAPPKESKASLPPLVDKKLDRTSSPTVCSPDQLSTEAAALGTRISTPNSKAITFLAFEHKEELEGA